MAKKVFIENPNSIYNDLPGKHYHFPKQYFSRVQEAVGDWVLFYESKPILEYKSVGKIHQVIPDIMPQHFKALIEPGTFLEFPTRVPFRLDGEVLNRSLLNEKGKISGRAQSAVRSISDRDFIRILELGLKDIDDTLPRFDNLDETKILQVGEDQAQFNYERAEIEQVLTKKVRNRAFRKSVLNAYNKTCAFSGFSLINGGGRAEVQAAHIVPVKHGGNDTLRNGIALCGTAHWMFDRGYLSLRDNFDIMVSRHINDLDQVNRLLTEDKKAIMPQNARSHPHPEYLEWHRKTIFKQ